MKAALSLFMLIGSFGALSAGDNGADFSSLMPMPRVDASILIPPIVKLNEEGLIAFRRTHPGFLSSGAFDTRIFRFGTDSAGKIARVSSSDRTILGEIPSGQWVAVPAGADTKIVELRDGDPVAIATIRELRDEIVVSCVEWRRRYVDGGESRFSLEERNGADSRETLWRLSGGGRTATLLEGGKIVRGELSRVGPDIFAYSEIAMGKVREDTVYEMTVWKTGNECRVALDAVEALGELYVLDIGELLAKSRNGLFNLAFIDSIMRSEGRITPLFVFFHLGDI
jgi:hypothetical protein